jgi:hypothetical protein
VISVLAFTSTIHDTDNRLGYLIEKVGEQLREAFKAAYVAYTPKTNPKIIADLQNIGYITVMAGPSVISTYRTALKLPLDKTTNCLFYCDFDRALHWIKTYPEELKQLTESPPGNDYVLIGRTKRAFQTHPETQTMTEGIGNTLASKMLSLPETRDILGTTWILTPELAEMIIKKESKNQFGFYTDWPETLWRSAKRPLYIEVEGLEWETPDRYREEIKTLGLEKWKQKFQTASEWRKRTEMLSDFIESSLIS